MPAVQPASQAFYRSLIAARLPAWLSSATAQDLQTLEALAARAEASRRALQAATSQLPQFRDYAAQVLNQRLHALGEQGVDPATAVLAWVAPDDGSPSLTCTLVEAALRNFSEDDTRAQAYGPGSGLFRLADGHGQPLAASRLQTTPWAFAQACRDADIGAGFARHLSSQLPLHAQAGAPGVERLPELFAQADRDALVAEAMVARLKGVLTATGQGLMATWGLAPTGAAAPRPATALRLRLNGFELDRVLVFLADEDSEGGRPCVLYVPNDPYAPLVQFPSPDALGQALRTRLAHPAYVRFLAGYVRLEQEAAFIAAVEGPAQDDFNRLFSVAVNPLRALQLAHRVVYGQQPFERPPVKTAFLPLADVFNERYTHWAANTLANAAVLATPTSRRDRIAAMARHEHWLALGEQLGLFVLSFIPGVGQIIAVYSMVQALHSVFDATRAWEQGDEARARALLLGAVDTSRLQLPGHLVAEEMLPHSLLSRLALIAGEGGESRLWLPDVLMLGTPAPPAGLGDLPADGVYRSQGRAWVRLADRYIEVAPDATAYQARPVAPVGYSGHVPYLLSNGAGGWRGEYERPARWSLAATIRRSGTDALALDDLSITLAQRFAGSDEASLRALAGRGEVLPGVLRYLLRRRGRAAALDQAAVALRERGQQPLGAPEVIRTLCSLPGWPDGIGVVLERPGHPDADLVPEAIGNVRLSATSLANGRWVADIIRQLRTTELAGLLGETMSLADAERALSARWAHLLEQQRATLLDRVGSLPPATLGEVPTRRLAGPLERQFPALPELVLADLIGNANSLQRSALQAGRVPLELAELAVQYQRQLRIGLACEALHDGRAGADRDALFMGLLPRLEGWPANLAIELRTGSADGRLVARAGGAQLPAQVIVDLGGRYQQHEPATAASTGPLGLEQTVAGLLRAQGGATSNALGNAPVLRERLSQLALEHRLALPALLGMAGNARRFFRPPSRFADGQLGYALSGRGPGAAALPADDPVAAWLQALYPQADGPALQALRQEVGEGPDAIAELARRQLAFNTLRVQLAQWLQRPASPEPSPGPGALAARDLAARVILQAWQRRFVCARATASDGPVRHSLSLAYLQTGASLPALNVTFPHILEVELSGMGLERVDPAFLAMFPNARLLRLNDNPLVELPRGPAWLEQLREVHLTNVGERVAGELLSWVERSAGTLQGLYICTNPGLPGTELLSRLSGFPRLRLLGVEESGIQLTAENQHAFEALPNLEVLSLDGNPLGVPPAVHNLTRLEWLSLADANLQTFVPGIEALMAQEDLRLTYINLAGNQIRQLPDLTATEFFMRGRRAPTEPVLVDLNLDGNPLDPEAVAMLDGAGFDFDPGEENDNEALPGFSDRWLAGCPQPLQGLILAAREEPAAAPFYAVLSEVVRTAPYVRARTQAQRDAVVGRAWALAERFLLPGEQVPPGITELRDHFYEQARDARGTCGDGVVLTLDQFEGEIAVWQALAESGAAGEDGPLVAALAPARRLFRQALVDAQAQRLVRARLARLGGAVAADPAADLADDVPPGQLMMGVDEVELRLALRQRLRGRLGLPAVSEQLYDTVLSEPTALRVAQRVEALDTADGFATWLLNHQHLWRRALERRYAVELEQARAPYDEAVTYVLARAAGEGVSPLSPQAVAVLETVEPEVQWPESSDASAPVLSEQQAYTISHRLGERANRATGSVRTRLALGLIG